MLSKVFWALVSLTAVLIVLTAVGYAVMPALIVMILIDILSIEAMRRADMKSINNDLAHVIAARFDSLDKLCVNISSSVSASRDDILRALGKEPVTVARPEAEPAEMPTGEAVIEPTDMVDTPKAEEPSAGFVVNYK